MKKLTAERRVIATDLIEIGYKAMLDAMPYRREMYMTPHWREYMGKYWKAEEGLQTLLGLSMTRANALLEKSKTLDDYFAADGTPFKGRHL